MYGVVNIECFYTDTRITMEQLTILISALRAQVSHSDNTMGYKMSPEEFYGTTSINLKKLHLVFKYQYNVK